MEKYKIKAPARRTVNMCIYGEIWDSIVTFCDIATQKDAFHAIMYYQAYGDATELNELNPNTQAIIAPWLDKIDEGVKKNPVQKENYGRPTKEMEKIRKAYNEVAEDIGLPYADKYNKSRIRKMKILLTSYSPNEIVKAIESIRNIEWLQDKDWLSFDWIIDEKNFAKISEGYYNREKKGKNKEDFGL